MLPKKAKSFGTGPDKGASFGGSFLDIPKYLVKEPPPRPAPAIITQPPVNKLRQPPVEPAPPPAAPPPPPLAFAAAGGGGGLALGAAAVVAGAIAIILFTPEPLSDDENFMFSPPRKEIEKSPPPFYGGQSSRVLYKISYLNYDENKRIIGSNNITVYGAIEKILQTYYPPDRYGYIKNVTEVFIKIIKRVQKLQLFLFGNTTPQKEELPPIR